MERKCIICTSYYSYQSNDLPLNTEENKKMVREFFQKTEIPEGNLCPECFSKFLRFKLNNKNNNNQSNSSSSSSSYKSSSSSGSTVSSPMISSSCDYQFSTSSVDKNDQQIAICLEYLKTLKANDLHILLKGIKASKKGSKPKLIERLIRHMFVFQKKTSSPPLNISAMSLSEIQKKLQAYGISTKGSRSELIPKLLVYYNLYGEDNIPDFPLVANPKASPSRSVHSLSPRINNIQQTQLFTNNSNNISPSLNPVYINQNNNIIHLIPNPEEQFYPSPRINPICLNPNNNLDQYPSSPYHSCSSPYLSSNTSSPSQSFDGSFVYNNPNNNNINQNLYSEVLFSKNPIFSNSNNNNNPLRNTFSSESTPTHHTPTNVSNENLYNNNNNSTINNNSNNTNIVINNNNNSYFNHVSSPPQSLTPNEYYRPFVPTTPTFLNSNKSDPFIKYDPENNIIYIESNPLNQNGNYYNHIPYQFQDNFQIDPNNIIPNPNENTLGHENCQLLPNNNVIPFNQLNKYNNNNKHN